jgi:hypothetical protein
MSRVFLAYKRVDIARALQVRSKLEALDVPLFMDVKMDAAQNYISVINQQLSEASAVLVLWTEASTTLAGAEETNFVISEAERGYARKILVAAAFDRVVQQKLPVPFNTIHAPDLSDWIETGASQTHPQWQKVLEAVGRRLERPGLTDYGAILESGTDASKRAFLRTHANDPGAVRIADEVEATERKEFEKRISTTQGRLTRRERDVEKRLSALREAFEASIQNLRAGQEYAPPDPVKALNDNASRLREQVELGEAALSALRADLAGAQQAARDKDAEIGLLSGQVSALQHRRPGRLALAAIALTCLIVGSAAAWSYAKYGLRDGDSAARSKMLDEREAGLTAREFARDASVKRREAELDGQGTSLRERENRLARDQQAFDSRDGDLKRRNEQLARDQQALAARERDVARREADIKTAADGGVRRAEERANALQVQVNRLQSRETTLQNQVDAAHREKEATLREKEALSTQLTQKRSESDDKTKQLQTANGTIATLNSRITDLQKEVATLKRPQGGPLPARVDPAVTRCDDLAGYQYDPDRPETSRWKENSNDIDVNSALEACEAALRVAGNDTTRRRITLQLGRVIGARGMSERGPQQKKSYDDAVERWKEAARLGSSQANNILGVHYRINKDFQNSWKHFKLSADQNNPAGLASAAYFLLFPELHDGAVRYNPTQGQQYLEGSLKFGHQRALFVRGRAMMEGRGSYANSPNRPEGLRQVALAFCGNDEEAKKFYSGTTDYEAPTCNR